MFSCFVSAVFWLYLIASVTEPNSERGLGNIGIKTGKTAEQNTANIKTN